MFGRILLKTKLLTKYNKMDFLFGKKMDFIFCTIKYILITDQIYTSFSFEHLCPMKKGYFDS